MSSIYQLNQEMMILLDLDQDDQAVQDTIEGLQMMVEEKCVNIIKYIKHLEDESEKIKTEIERLKSMEVDTNKQIDRLKDSVLNAMQINDLDKIDDSIYPIKKTKPRQSVDVFDESLIPTQFVKEKVTRTISKTDITKAIKAGEDVGGARLVDGKAGLKY